MLGVILMVAITVMMGAVLYVWLGGLITNQEEVSARITVSPVIERQPHTDTITAYTTVTNNIWTQKTPTTAPSARSNQAMATIYGTDKIVLFGGNDTSSINSDTWVYDISENSWTNMSSPSSPMPRLTYHALASVYGTDKVVLYGGYSSDYNQMALPVTYIYDLSENSWTDVSVGPLDLPDPRVHHAMASIYGDDKIVLFGGIVMWIDGTTSANDTWVFDTSDIVWTHKTPATSPSPRSNHAMATIYGDDKVVLFGGNDTNSVNSETWIYDLSDDNWTQKTPATSPSPKGNHAMTGVYGDDKVVLFGGNDTNSINSEIWVYDSSDNTWTKKTPANAPSPRSNHAMATIYDDDNVVLFGGNNTATLNAETWIYDLSVTSLVPVSVSYGSSIDYVITIASVSGEAPLDKLKFTVTTPQFERIAEGTITSAVSAGSANTTAVKHGDILWYAIPSGASIPSEPYASGKYWRSVNSSTNITSNASYIENAAFLILDKDADGKLSPYDSIRIYVDIDNSTINKNYGAGETGSGIEVYENCVFKISVIKNNNQIVSLTLPT